MSSNPTGGWGCLVESEYSWAATANIFSSRGTANMKALLLTEYMNLQVTELAEPEIGAADVLVRVRACGICGSDVHGLDGRTGRRIPPLVMGHEAAGTIEAIGREVRGWRAGVAPVVRRSEGSRHRSNDLC